MWGSAARRASPTSTATATSTPSSGSNYGTLHYFENTGSAVAPAFTERTGAANPFDGVNVGFSSAPSFADLDGDGDLDAVVGVVDGTLHYFENTGTALAPAFTARTGAANPFNGVDVGYTGTPSFADLDGDGDLDAIVGASDGTLHYFTNTGAGFTLVVNVTAQNDAATLSADVLNLTETNAAADISSSGTLTITDPDSPATFVAQAGTAGSYGTFAIDQRRRLDLHRKLRPQRVRGRHHLHRHLPGRQRRRHPYLGDHQHPRQQRRRGALRRRPQPDRDQCGRRHLQLRHAHHHRP